MLHYCSITENLNRVTVQYFNQIIDNDLVQDFTSVACCLESDSIVDSCR